MCLQPIIYDFITIIFKYTKKLVILNKINNELNGHHYSADLNIILLQ